MALTIAPMPVPFSSLPLQDAHRRRGWPALLFALLLCSNPATAEVSVALDGSEHAYLDSHRPTLCVDPDWWPFEVIDEKGRHAGVAADLHALVRERIGLQVDLYPARTWAEQLAASRAGRCELLSFVNRSPEREAWLIFTEPLLRDPNVLITREEFPFISDLASLRDKSIALPLGTAMYERVALAFPNLRLIGTVSEDEAIGMVSDRRADMTLRSLIVAAHTIKQHGWFNLKINGQLPGYENQLRIGVLKSETLLRDILDKGIATLTAAERNRIVDRHLQIKMVTDVDYTLVKWLAALLLAIVATSLYWLRRLRRLNGALQTALVEVRANEAEQRHFISMLSHEIRSPLAVIDSSVQLLALRSTAETHPVLARIRRGIARLSGFFDNSLTQDRLNSRNFTLQHTDVDIGEVATWAVESAELQSERHSIHLEQPAGLPMLTGDPTLLRILLANLLSNAIKYSPPDSSIELCLSRVGNICRIEVADHGPGIPEDELELIFQRFRRGRSAGKTPGAGLGLALAARIVALHGGRISAGNRPQGGACFTVELPLPASMASAKT